MSSRIYDVVIIGGGMAGVHAAYPLVKAGYQVALVDGGVVSDVPFEEWYEDNFEEIRETRADQYTLFLGKDLSAVPITIKNHAMSMTSGSRSYITKYTEEMLPLELKNASILQSLSKGGLGEAWGAVCEVFDDEELKMVGLPIAETKKSYQEIIDRIGVSGKRENFRLQPPIVPDVHAKKILKIYKNKKNKFMKDNILVFQSALALLTKKLNKRSPTEYNDMDFWSNKGLAIYRPSITIDEMREKKNFFYLPGIVVTVVKEKKDFVEIEGVKIDRKKKIIIKGKKVIVAAGSINTVRILLKSYSLYNEKVPFLYKQNILIPALHLANIDLKKTKKQVSFCQIVIVNKNKIAGLSKFYIQLYSYKSLLLHKLVSYIPFPIRETMTFLSIFTPHMMLIDVRFPNNMQNKAYLVLKKKGIKEYIQIHPLLSKQMLANMNREIKKVKKILRALQLLPLKTVFPQKGATAHYAGGIPFESAEAKNIVLTVNQHGKLNRSKSIYIADASCWLALPPKPPSLTIMAHANTVGKNVLRDLS